MARKWMVVLLVAAVLSAGAVARYEYVAFKAQNERIGMQSYALLQFAGRMDLLERGVGKAQNAVQDLAQSDQVLESEVSRTAREITSIRADFTEITADVDALGGRLVAEANARATAVGAAMMYGERVVARVRELEAKLATVKERIEALGTASAEVNVLHTELATVTTDVTAMHASLHRDPMEKLRAMIIPTVQVTCGIEMGSGAIVWSGRQPDRDGITTYVLTAHHVVAASDGTDVVCGVQYDVTGQWDDPQGADAEFVVGDANRDLALIRMKTQFVFPTVARIPARGAGARLQVFTPIYAVGCPLGYAPMPTWGELSSKSKRLGGMNHWMISAPTIFGNSGGGIYTADTYELIGILSRVSAYNNFINVAVPHMGILVPIDTVREWLEEEEYGFITTVDVVAVQEEERGIAAPPTASAQR